MRIEFFVAGTARPAGSKGAFKHKQTGKIIVTHANPATKTWMDTVRFFALQEAKRMIPTTEPVCLKLIFLKERPKGHFGTGRNDGVLKPSAPQCFTIRPDLTKLTRAVEDAMTGVIWKDDSQVMAQATIKRYCRGDEIPGVLIIVEAMDTQQLKGVCHDTEHEIRGQGTGSLFGSTWREGADNGGHQSIDGGLPQGQHQLHGTVA